MEDNKKDVLNNQPKKEEKEKKNKFLVWWLGLGKWARVGICAGAAAVLATAITLPIVLTQNKGGKTPESFSGIVTAEQWKEALTASISFGVETNFTCTIHDTYDEEHDTTIKMDKNKCSTKHFMSEDYHTENVYEDYFGYFVNESLNQWFYRNVIDGPSLTRLTFYAKFKTLYSNADNYNNYTFDSAAKEYKLKESENYGEDKLTSVKFKDEKHIEKAVIFETGSGSTTTYTFEYGKTTLSDFPKNSAIKDLNYNGNFSSADSVTLATGDWVFYEIDMNSFPSFNPNANDLKCYLETTSIYSVNVRGVYVNRNKIDVTYDSETKNFSSLGTLSNDSKILFFVGGAEEANPSMTFKFHADVVNK